MRLDIEGNLYVAAGIMLPRHAHETNDVPPGVYVFSPQGQLIEFLPVPRDECTNCAFGGDDLKTLYVTAGGTLWSARVRVPGRPAWPASGGPEAWTPCRRWRTTSQDPQPSARSTTKGTIAYTSPRPSTAQAGPPPRGGSGGDPSSAGGAEPGPYRRNAMPHERSSRITT